MEPSFKIRNNKNTKKRAAEIDAGAEYAAKDGDESKDSAFGGDREANHAIAQKIGVNRKTVILWRGRFRKKNGIVGLKDGTRPGRKPKIAPGMVRRVIDMTLQKKPRAGTHWSNRTLGKELNISKNGSTADLGTARTKASSCANIQIEPRQTFC